MIVLAVYHGHNAAVAILEDGRLLLNLERERHSRIKNDYGYDPEFVRFCLDRAGLTIDSIDLVCLNGSTFYATFPDSGVDRISPPPPPPLIDTLRSAEVEILGRRVPGIVVHHHLAHLACAFFTSPFERAAVLSLDGGGDGLTLSLAWGDGNTLGGYVGIDQGETSWPGLWEGYTRTNYGMSRSVPLRDGVPARLSYLPGEGPGKLMALAAYGRFDEATARQLEYSRLVQHRPNQQWIAFNYNEDLSDSRSPRAQDVAHTLQELTGQHVAAMLDHTAEHLARQGRDCENLCYAGGLALNCIATSAALRISGRFRRIHVPPCPHDGGLALGMALAIHHIVHRQPRTPGLFSPYTGPHYGAAAIDRAAADAAADGIAVQAGDAAGTARLLADGHIVALWREGSECGPRALGHRSLLARPDLPDLRDRLNRIKGREWYRPFAPIILEEAADTLLTNAPDHSHYMTTSALIAPAWRQRLAGVCHVDGSTRPQILKQALEPYLHEVITRVAEATGTPAVLNTSFNYQEPIVETPAEAVATFRRLDIGHLVLHDRLLTKTRPTGR